ncbi:MAG: peptide deformylase [candidate division KSB1 bacterium]|nr:peptide deformylase [candidate division KSB1 bacterium]MDZ7368070.1 peptide deformylase [candidate division KSB1 bacterium]MDZ7405704.1 peptide deformylase [candidate division KSB1 bacterium]
MAVWPIRKYGDPILRKKAMRVELFDEPFQQVAADMIETMQAAKGIGLAANQIGLTHALCVVDLGLIEEGAAPKAFVNPVILQEEGKLVPYEEGCLSIPEINEEVMRKERVLVRYQDLTGAVHEQQCDGMLARVLQHEIDHLNGVFFVDRLSALKRKLLSKKLRAIAEEAAAEARERSKNAPGARA